jgi:MarR family transcriptional regulator, temperature-dependent positive regulator of motility
MIKRNNNLAEKSEPEDSEPSYPILSGAAAPLKLSATHLIHRAEQCAADIFVRLAPKGLLTPRQYAILVAIEESQGISQTGLVEKTGIDRSTLADIMRRMINKGLVERERTAEDARTYAVRLTRKGVLLLRRMKPVAEQVDSEILQALPEEYRNLFLSILNHLVTRMPQPQSSAK